MVRQMFERRFGAAVTLEDLDGSTDVVRPARAAMAFVDSCRNRSAASADNILQVSPVIFSLL